MLLALDPALTSDPAGLHNFWKNSGINVAVCTPTFLKLCLTDPEFSASGIPSLRTVYSCGERLDSALAARLLHRFPDLSLINAYGPTEATSAVCAVTITKEMTEAELLPAGELSTAACEIVIDEGEIVLKGKSVFSGYLDSVKGGWFLENGKNCYRTGDLGKIQEGYLYCIGRMDRQIKWKGYRIELDEIEHVMSTLPGVQSCAVVAKHAPSGEVRAIKAYVVPTEEEDRYAVSGREQALRILLADKLPPYMLPKTIEYVDALPVNANGKTDRKELEKR